MVNKHVFKLTKDQANKAVELCLENAKSYLKDVEISIANHKTDHLAIPIEFALEEIGKAKVIYDKMIISESEITLSYKDGIYDHGKKLDVATSLIDLSEDEKIVNSLVFGDDPIDYLLDPLVISVIDDKVKELRDSGKKGHEIRLASSFVDFDPHSCEPKIEKSSGNLQILIDRIHEIIVHYPSSFNTK